MGLMLKPAVHAVAATPAKNSRRELPRRDELDWELFENIGNISAEGRKSGLPQGSPQVHFKQLALRSYSISKGN